MLPHGRYHPHATVCWFTRSAVQVCSVRVSLQQAALGRKKKYLHWRSWFSHSVSRPTSRSSPISSAADGHHNVVFDPARAREQSTFFFLLLLLSSLFTLEDKTQQQKENTMTTQRIAETPRRGGDGCFSLRWPSGKLQHYSTIARQSLPERELKLDMLNVSHLRVKTHGTGDDWAGVFDTPQFLFSPFYLPMMKKTKRKMMWGKRSFSFASLVQPCNE